MAETNLTTTITSEDYANLLWKVMKADQLAEAVAADWLSSTQFAFIKPGDATLNALRRYDEHLYEETKKKREEAEAKAAEAIKKAADRIINPALPYLTQDGPGIPIQEIKIGDDPGSDPQITCENKN